MNKIKTYTRKKIVLFTAVVMLMFFALAGRLIYLMVIRADYYGKRALDIQQRERIIKAPRGRIIDRNNTVLASNVTVCTISVIHSQITDAEKVISVLSKELDLAEDKVRKRVEKVSSIEKIASNIDKETGDIIRAYNLDGVKIDEDYKRYYPFSILASKVLGFTGADNQGIVGLEVMYDSYLKGKDGKILTLTNSRGIELSGKGESRQESVAGNDLYISLDYNIQKYAQQIAEKALEAKQANYVSIIVMDPNNGEILAMVNAPEFDLNEPFVLNYETSLDKNDEEYMEQLNKMWRNQCINDTYEPGSTFKIITATAGLEENVVNIDSRFYCPGYEIVEDRRIRCHKTTGHGAETFLEATMNSCNPVFIEVGLRVGTDNFYKYLEKLGLMSLSGIDLPGEASTILHNKENVGTVELATMSFGQSFQITPIQFLTSVSAVINGGTLVTPHLGVEVRDSQGNVIETFKYETKEDVVSEETSETVKYILEKVISEGTGAKAQVEGYSIGGKTATSQKLPRSANKYIASFVGFAPADNPKVIAIAIVDEPEGVYYGGSVAAPLIQELYENILPYLEIEKTELITSE